MAQYDDIIKYQELSCHFIMSLLNQNLSKIAKLSKDRVSTIGEVEYGSASFDKSTSELVTEIFEELADALFYASLIIKRRDDG